jgi:hypothetical protein
MRYAQYFPHALRHGILQGLKGFRVLIANHPGAVFILQDMRDRLGLDPPMTRARTT